jgi:hypothetical protein
MSEKQLEWLKSKAGYLKILQIEKELAMPRHHKEVRGRQRELPEKWKPKVTEWIKELEDRRCEKSGVTQLYT